MSEHKIPPRFIPWKRLEGHTRAISSIKFSPDGRIIASASADRTVRLWKADTGEALGSLQDYHQKGINDIAWSHDSKYVTSASDDKTLVIWDTERMVPLNTLKGHDKLAFTVKYSPASNMLVSGSFDETVRIWDVKSGAAIKSIVAHSDPVSAVAFEPIKGETVLSGSWDGLCRLWDLNTYQCVKTVYDTKSSNIPAITYVTFTPNGKFFCAASLDNTIRLWDKNSSKSLIKRSFTGHKNETYNCASTIAWKWGEKRLAQPFVLSGSDNGFIHCWTVNKPKKSHVKYQAYEKATPIFALDSSTSAPLVACGSRPPKPVVQLLRVQTKEEIDREHDQDAPEKAEEASSSSGTEKNGHQKEGSSGQSADALKDSTRHHGTSGRSSNTGEQANGAVPMNLS